MAKANQSKKPVKAFAAFGVDVIREWDNEFALTVKGLTEESAHLLLVELLPRLAAR